MADDIREDADNEITRIVRRPGPAKLPINVAAPVAPSSPSAAPVSPPQVSVTDETVLAAPMRVAAANVNTVDGVPPVAPPGALDRQRPMDRPVMTPPRPPTPQGAVPPVPGAQGAVPRSLVPDAIVAAVAQPATPPMPPRPGPAEPFIVRPTPAAPIASAAPLVPEPPKPTVAEAVQPAAPPVAIVPPPAPAAPSIAPPPLPIEPVVGWLVIVKGPGRGTAREIVTGRNGIGSASGQDIRLDFGDPAIAPQGHAYIVYDDEAREFVVEDGKQKIVVRLNGKLLTETMPIGHGDELRIGATTLRFVALCGADFDWGDEKPSEAATPVEAPADAVAAIVEEG